MVENNKRLWAVILGSSSGFGEANARELARLGYDIFGVHLDRRATLPLVEQVVAAIRAAGREAVFFNVNAADAEKRKEVITQIRARLDGSQGQPGTVRILLHSLAFGTLKPYVNTDNPIGQEQMEMTVDVMAHSLVYWVRDLLACQLLERGARIFAMTSAGGTRVLPNYGPVSAAKAALESHIRQLAMELAPLGIAVNAVRAGVTDTPALRKIPGHEKLIEFARLRNPHGRLTTPQDVAAAIGALSPSGNLLDDGQRDWCGRRRRHCGVAAWTQPPKRNFIAT